MQELKKRIDELCRLIRRHEYAYYVEAAPIVSDGEFDALMTELRNIENAHPELVTATSPTRRVGGIATSFEIVTHRVPMMSLENAYSTTDLADWITRMRKLAGDRVFPVVAELKIDGVSASITYRDGAFIAAATRGDGINGDLVTGNIRTVRTLPLTIESRLDMDLRGEIFLPRSRLHAINQERIETGEELFKNCRNLAAGTLKSLDPKIPAERGLQLFVYGIAQALDLGFKRHSEVLAFLTTQGFMVNSPHRVCNTLEEINTWLEEVARLRSTLDFDIDGVVLKVDDLATQQELGDTAKAPRWAIAYKFAQEQRKTRLLHVAWQVGRSQMTPVAHLDPVELGGTTVSRASLHNLDQIREKDIRIGDHVIIEKAGYIIPYVVKACFEERSGVETEISVPSSCPACEGPVEIIRKADEIDTGTIVRCANNKCQGTLVRRLTHFISQLEIENIGPKLVERLVKSGRISQPTDFFRLTREDLFMVERMGEKLADKLLGNIGRASEVQLSRLISALGIPNVGTVAAEDMATHFGSLEAFRAATIEKLLEIHGVGEKVAGDVITFISDERHRSLLDDLSHFWKGPSQNTESRPAQIFHGMTFVITGSATQPRGNLERFVKDRGGRISSSVSSKTSVLVIGSLEGPEYVSEKKSKAIELGIRIIDEHALLGGD
ncbi:MAG: NAD-dependent DNA ligase LigA [Candidatus Riflebacteria bacterium]|nr:NAD-dependent DNA ligase LigA [Candidatus Riflebacteria bacterium]